MNNPLEILRALDAQLERPTELTLFGRAAIALGYPGAGDNFRRTEDVDVIFPTAQLEILGEDPSFWTAQDRVNEQLADRALYLTHLFSELDIIIPADWMTRRVGIASSFKNLRLYRPATVDLIVTKMMRGDRQDLEDIQFLLEQEPISSDTLKTTFAKARVPELPELELIFQEAQPKVFAIARAIEQNRTPR